MKNTLRTLLIMVWLGVALQGQAQRSFIIPKAGLYVSGFNGNAYSGSTFSGFGADSKSTTNALYSFSGGVAFDLGINNIFSIQPEILYSQSGAVQNLDFSVFGGGGNRDVTTRLNYLQVPVLLKLSIGGEKIRGYVNAGPYVGYALSGTIKSDGSFGGLGSSNNSDLKFNDEDDFQRLDYGASVGGGFGVGAGPGLLGIDVRYNYGIANVYKNPENDQKGQNSGLGVYLQYMIPFGRN